MLSITQLRTSIEPARSSEVVVRWESQSAISGLVSRTPTSTMRFQHLAGLPIAERGVVRPQTCRLLGNRQRSELLRIVLSRQEELARLLTALAY